MEEESNGERNKIPNEIKPTWKTPWTISKYLIDGKFN